MDIKIKGNVWRDVDSFGSAGSFCYRKNHCDIMYYSKEGFDQIVAYIERSPFVDKYLATSPYFFIAGNDVIYKKGYEVPVNERWEATDKLKDKIQKEIDRAKKLEREEKYR